MGRKGTASCRLSIVLLQSPNFFLSQQVALKDGWMSVWIGMTGGMDKHWGEKELPRVGYQLASCSLLISYVLIVQTQDYISCAKDVCTADLNRNCLFTRRWLHTGLSVCPG